MTCLAMATAVALAMAVLFEGEEAVRLDVLVNLEAKLLDLRFRARGPQPTSGEVVVVAIDDRSLDAIGRWPWSRDRHAALVDRLREWGASVVAFDTLFSEHEGVQSAEPLQRVAAALPSGGDSLAAARELLEAAMAQAADGPTDFGLGGILWQIDAALPPAGDPAALARQVIAAEIEMMRQDRSFAAAIERTYDDSKALTVLGFHFVLLADRPDPRALGRVLSSDDEAWILDLATYPSRDANRDILRTRPPSLALALRPVVIELAEVAAGQGYVNPVFDPDGVLRRERLVAVYSSGLQETFAAGQPVAKALRETAAPVQAYMPLAVAAVVTHLGLTIDQIELDMVNGQLRFAGPAGEPRVHHFDPQDGTTLIDYYGPARTFPTHSFIDVLEATLRNREGRSISGPEAFAGRLVFVGATAQGLSDTYTTPFTTRLAGVEKHANVAENLLRGRQLRTHGNYELAVILTAFAGALIVALVAGNLTSLAAGLVLLVGSAAWLIYTWLDFIERGLVWNLTMPLLTVLLGYAVITAYRQLTEERAKRHVRSVFSTYLSPESVKELLDDPSKLKLGGERRTCTVFFSDVVGFTTISETIGEPEVLVSLMNRYLGRMTDLILEERGMLDKYIGDAIMALFGVARAKADHAARACRAALKNRAALVELGAELAAEGLPPIDCRIGINTGEVVIGNMGSSIRMNYTAIGDAVNLASRLEGAGKAYGAHVLVGERTYQEAAKTDKKLVFRPLDLLVVKGKNEPARVFELVGYRGKLSARQKQATELFSAAIERYRDRDFAAALEIFEQVLECDPDDGPAHTYVARCQQFQEHPPPEDWDGVFRMQTK